MNIRDGQVMLTDSNNAFAFNLYRQLGEESGDSNVFFSPFSILICLSMALEGARGQTADEMASVLQIPDSRRRKFRRSMTSLLESLARAQDDDTHADIRARITDLRQQLHDLEARERNSSNADELRTKAVFRQHSRENYQEMFNKETELNQLLSRVDQFELSIANALWGEQTCPFRQDFLDILTSLYGSDAFILCDFKHKHVAEVWRINRWISEKTHGKIENLLSEANLHPPTALVLVNAICFKGEWDVPFAKRDTKPRWFYPLQGDRIKTAQMHNPHLSFARYGAFNADDSPFETPNYVEAEIDEDSPAYEYTDTSRGFTAGAGRSEAADESYGYPADGGLQVLELPYKGDVISMVLLLPKRTEDLAELESRLTPARLGTYLKELKRRPVAVTLPRFNCETSYTLNNTLQSMGMSTAFKNPLLEEGANFWGMTDNAKNSVPLFIDLVAHRAMVDVNEKGTEAVGVTATFAEFGCAIVTIPFVPKFRADRPFIYLILHRETGIILFLGRMTKPNG